MLKMKQNIVFIDGCQKREVPKQSTSLFLCTLRRIPLIESDAITKRHILRRSLDCQPPRFECLPLLFPGKNTLSYFSFKKSWSMYNGKHSQLRKAKIGKRWYYECRTPRGSAHIASQTFLQQHFPDIEQKLPVPRRNAVRIGTMPLRECGICPIGSKLRPQDLIRIIGNLMVHL